MKRRTFVGGLLGSAAMTFVPRPLFASVSQSSAWDELRRRIGSRLIPIRSPLVAAARSGGVGADALFKALKNPFYLGDDPSLTQTLGWTGAWTSQPSAMGVAAETASDVAAAVEVTRKHKLRLVVKGGGHSYFGNSNAAGSLLVWTRRMDSVELHDDFVPQGAPPGTAGEAAASVGAGAIWGRVYDSVAVNGGRYIQGGGCLTVGVAGFAQGGGFGSLSKQFGTGAANLLEAEVVTADGKVRIANPISRPRSLLRASRRRRRHLRNRDAADVQDSSAADDDRRRCLLAGGIKRVRLARFGGADYRLLCDGAVQSGMGGDDPILPGPQARHPDGLP